MAWRPRRDTVFSCRGYLAWVPIAVFPDTTYPGTAPRGMATQGNRALSEQGLCRQLAPCKPTTILHCGHTASMKNVKQRFIVTFSDFSLNEQTLSFSDTKDIGQYSPKKPQKLYVKQVLIMFLFGSLHFQIYMLWKDTKCSKNHPSILDNKYVLEDIISCQCMACFCSIYDHNKDSQAIPASAFYEFLQMTWASGMSCDHHNSCFLKPI